MSDTETECKEDTHCNTIVTGQQIGQLGGPLYTTYKVLGAISLARQINGHAVYWLETNDADFNEINHIDFQNAEGDLETLTWDIDSQGYSCGLIDIDDTLPTLLEGFFAGLHQTEFTPGLRDLALDCYRPGRTLGEASMQLASELFKGFDVQLFTPADPEFRAFSRKILLNEAGKTPDGEQCNVFVMFGKQRKALFRKGDKFQLRDGTTVNLEAHELVPNVFTRNVCQDAYFNAHSYVAGPGEVKYIAGLDDQYAFHGVKKAAVRPRMSLRLIEPRVRRMINKTGISLEDILNLSREELIKKVLADKSQTGLDPNLAQQTSFRLTEEYLEQLDGLGLEAADIKQLRKLLRPELKNALGKLRAREKEKHQKLLADVGFLSDNLMPFGKPQERVFNIFHYMNLYGGLNFIRYLYDHHEWNRTELEIEYVKK